jgi:hypothetical protein
MRKFLTTFASILVLGCQGQGPEPSHTKVTNGIQTRQFPAVQLVQGNGYSCTGTFVSPRTLITAAHCVNSASSTGDVGVVSRITGRLEKSTKLIIGKYETELNNGVNYSDLSVVLFDKDIVAESNTATVASQEPAIGSALTIVGYGNNLNYTFAEMNTRLEECMLRGNTRPYCQKIARHGEGSGTKRMGTNTVAALQRGMIVFYGVNRAADGVGTGLDVSSGSGDSGGPMFVNDELVGVTSGGTDTISQYVNLNSFSSRALLRRAMSEGAVIKGLSPVQNGDITAADFKVSVEFEDQRESNSGKLQGFRLRLTPSERALQEVKTVSFDIHPTFSPRYSVIEADAARGVFVTEKRYTYASGWDTQGVDVLLKNNTKIKLPGTRIDWSHLSEQKPIVAADFTVKVQFGAIESVEGRPWMPFSFELDGSPSALDAVKSVNYQRHATFGSDASETVSDRATKFRSKSVKTYSPYWQAQGTRIELKDGRSFDLDGVMIDWRAQRDAYFADFANSIKPEDLTLKVTYGTLNAQKLMPFTFSIEASEKVLEQIASVTYGRHATFGKNETIAYSSLNPNFTSSTSLTYASGWKADDTIVHLKNGRDIVLKGPVIQWVAAPVDSKPLKLGYSSSSWGSYISLTIEDRKLTLVENSREIKEGRTPAEVVPGESVQTTCTGTLSDDAYNSLVDRVKAEKLDAYPSMLGAANQGGRKSRKTHLEVELGDWTKKIEDASDPSTPSGISGQLLDFIRSLETLGREYATNCAVN